MPKRTLFKSFLLLLGGFSVLAAVAPIKLGDYDLNTLTHVAQFMTGKASLARNKGVQVYNPRTNKRYQKTKKVLRKLPKGAVVKVNPSLINTKTITLSTPQSINSICSRLSVWKCIERLEYHNRISDPNQQVSTITTPAFFPAIPPPPPAIPTTPAPQQPLQNTPSTASPPLQQILNNPQFWQIIALVLLTLLIISLVVLMKRQTPAPAVYIPEDRPGSARRYMGESPWTKWRNILRSRRNVILGYEAAPRPVSAQTKTDKLVALEAALASRRIIPISVDQTSWPLVNIAVPAPETTEYRRLQDRQFKAALEETSDLVTEEEFIAPRSVTRDAEHSTPYRVFTVRFRD